MTFRLFSLTYTVILCAFQPPGLRVSVRSVSAGVRSRVHCESSAPDNLNLNADRCRYSVRHLHLGRLSRQASIFSSAMPCSERRSVTLPCRPHLTGSASNQLRHHNKRNHSPSSSPHVGWSRNWKASGHICKPATYDSACLGFKIVNYLAASHRLAETVQPCYLYADERQALPSLIPAEESLLEQPLSHTCT